MFRELAEEVGLRPEHVQVIGCTRGWLRYRLPKYLVRQSNTHLCIGQKQVWFLLRMLGDEQAVRLDLSERPEFDHWQWVDYWYPLRAVVWFKRHVYWRALRELAPLLFASYSPPLSAAIDLGSERERVPLHRNRAQPHRPSLPERNRPSPASISVPARRHTAPPASTTTRPEPPTLVALRRVETCQHPVITRMVISTRRFHPADTTLTGPLSEPLSALPPAPSQPTRSTTSSPRHWSRR